MEIINLDQDTVEYFTDYLSEDMAENIGRMYYDGFIVRKGDEPVAGIIWHFKNVQSEKEKESQIVFLKIDDEEATDILFENYAGCIAGEDITKSTFVLPAASSEREKASLEKAGFSAGLMEGDIIRAKLSDVAELALMEKTKVSNDILPIRNLSQGEFTAAIRHFAQKGLHGLCEDLIYLPKTYFENDVSCYVQSDGGIKGLMLLHKLPSGALSIVIMAYIGDDYARILPRMMRGVLSGALEHYSPDTEIMIDRHNYSVLALSEKLFPSGFGIPVYQGSRIEK